MKLDHGWVMQQYNLRDSGCRNGEIMKQIQLKGGDIDNVNQYSRKKVNLTI